MNVSDGESLQKIWWFDLSDRISESKFDQFRMASRATSSSATAAPSAGTPPPRTPAARQSRPSSAAPRSSPGPSRPASAARLSVKAASVSERLSKPHARPNSANPNKHGTGGFFWSPDNLGAAVAQSVPTLSKSASSPGLRQQNARQLDEWYEINRKAQYSLRAMNQCGHETDMLMERVSEAKRESLSRAVEGLNETLDETRRKADAKQEQHYQLKREMLTGRKEWLAQGGQHGATHEARKVDALETMIEQVEGAYRTEGDRMQATHSPLPPLTHPHSPSRPSHAPAGRQSHGAHTPHPHLTSSSSEPTRARVTATLPRLAAAGDLPAHDAPPGGRADGAAARDGGAACRDDEDRRRDGGGAREPRGGALQPPRARLPGGRVHPALYMPCRLGCRSLDSQTSTHSHAQPDQLLSLWLTRARRPTYNAGTDSKRSAIMEAELKQRHAALQEVNRIEASFERRAEARKLIPQRVQVRGGVGRRPLAALCPFAALRSSPALPLT